MHTSITDTPNNLMVAFRSSPYGAVSHMHASQNGFNILYGGKRLVRNTGYYIAASDPHCQEWYRTTRGHNSVLIDGKGQTRGGEGYGWIARYLHGRKISYCLGDASNAYGDAGVTRFRRHFMLLRPGTIVIYDDLEADHPADWGWLIHSARRMTANSKLGRLRTIEQTARTQVHFMGSVPLKFEVDTKFDPPAINWSNRSFNGKKGCPDQWHATVSPAEPCCSMRYLAVLQVRATEDKSDYDFPMLSQEGWLTVGAWEIFAEMDASKTAAIEVRHRDGSAVLAVDRQGMKLGPKKFRSGQGESILAEGVGKKTLIERSQDELPEAAR